MKCFNRSRNSPEAGDSDKENSRWSDACHSISIILPMTFIASGYAFAANETENIIAHGKCGDNV